MKYDAFFCRRSSAPLLQTEASGSRPFQIRRLPPLRLNIHQHRLRRETYDLQRHFFKSSFLENVTEFSILDTLIGLGFALVIGLFIFVIYKKNSPGCCIPTALP